MATKRSRATRRSIKSTATTSRTCASSGAARLYIIGWALAREERGTDERMLELLEPYRGQRGRVQVLLERSHISPPAYGPRMEARSIEKL